MMVVAFIARALRSGHCHEIFLKDSEKALLIVFRLIDNSYSVDAKRREFDAKHKPRAVNVSMCTL